jgi:hypothetical protein
LEVKAEGITLGRSRTRASRASPINKEVRLLPQVTGTRAEMIPHRRLHGRGGQGSISIPVHQSIQRNIKFKVGTTLGATRAPPMATAKTDRSYGMGSSSSSSSSSSIVISLITAALEVAFLGGVQGMGAKDTAWDHEAKFREDGAEVGAGPGLERGSTVIITAALEVGSQRGAGHQEGGGEEV